MAAPRSRISGILGLVAGLGVGWAAFHLLLPSPRVAPPEPWILDEAPSADWEAALGSSPAFRDVAEECGIRFVHSNGLTGKFHYPELMGAGVALLDYDGDGFLDVFLVQGNRLQGPKSADLASKLFHNRGDGSFEDATERAGVGLVAYGQGACVGDYDNDGDPDLYVSCFGPNVLFRNDGDGTFTDVTRAAGVSDANPDPLWPNWGQSCSFLDYDGDGLLDLYVQNYLTYSLSIEFVAYTWVGERKVLDYPAPQEFRGAPDHLYRNAGDGTFTDVTAEAGMLRPEGKGMGVACFDFDDDGRTDIYVTNDSMENYLFRNVGGGRFEEIGLAAGVAFDGTGIAEASMGADVGDFDGDGRFDLVTPCVWGQVFSLYRNEGTHFADASLRAGLARSTSAMTGFSPAFLDYDNDGDLDLYLSTAGVRMREAAPPDGSWEERYGLPDLLLSNDGSGRYVDVSRAAGPHFQRRTVGHGSAVGDLDNDGDLDIVVGNLGGRAAVLRNETRGGHWISLELEATKGNRDALGASAWCESGGRRRRALVHGGVSYCSQNARRLHFGLGAADRVDRIEVRWPDGETQVLEGLRADRILRLRQGEAPRD